jgi:hypothetical protein
LVILEITNPQSAIKNPSSIVHLRSTIIFSGAAACCRKRVVIPVCAGGKIQGLNDDSPMQPLIAGLTPGIRWSGKGGGIRNS